MRSREDEYVEDEEEDDEEEYEEEEDEHEVNESEEDTSAPPGRSSNDVTSVARGMMSITPSSCRARPMQSRVMLFTSSLAVSSLPCMKNSGSLSSTTTVAIHRNTSQTEKPANKACPDRATGTAQADKNSPPQQKKTDLVPAPFVDHKSPTPFTNMDFLTRKKRSETGDGRRTWKQRSLVEFPQGEVQSLCPPP